MEKTKSFLDIVRELCISPISEIKYTDAGCYWIFCRETGYSYIGASIHLRERIGSHKRGIATGTHSKKEMAEDGIMYGIECFEFVVIELCTLSSVAVSEQYWLSRFSHLPVYNKRMNGLKRLGSLEKIAIQNTK